MRGKSFCPYCYHRIPLRKLWYQCNGRGSNKREGCRAESSDEARAREFKYTAKLRPSYGPPRFRPTRAPRQGTCPDCGGVSGIRVCPNCHTPLPPGFEDSRSPLIAMIGAKNTGKTVYLTVLANELRTSLRRRFQADVRLTADLQDDQESSLQRLDKQIELLYHKRTLLDFTRSAAENDGRRDALVFEWRQARRRRLAGTHLRTTYLSFYDTAGEDLSSRANTVELKYLDAAEALIVLLDPFMLPQARDRLHVPKEAINGQPIMEVLGNVTDTLRESRRIGNRRIDLPVAVVFAKIDAFFEALGSDHRLLNPPDSSTGYYDETAGRDTHEDVRALLDDFGADAVDTHLTAHYRDFRYFAVSALGAQPDYRGAAVESGGVRPFRVDEPLLWLLSRFGVVPSRERK
ncbi:hypothetical protein OG792_05740 [Micromonospora sp. NBC_01699]|uniref:hypothetical protein n=1 Tax=Micromonospora sp. NBC_01699 TaxID=2975984 RepID=UPI002E34AB90|nr:hypothetical protein [Micromonospora sp. NBC_01699]